MLDNNLNRSTKPQSAWPCHIKEAGVPIIFEITLSNHGEIKEGTVIKAYVDDSQQYEADGICWRACSTSYMIAVGQRLEKHQVKSWRAIESETKRLC